MEAADFHAAFTDLASFCSSKDLKLIAIQPSKLEVVNHFQITGCRHAVRKCIEWFYTTHSYPLRKKEWKGEEKEKEKEKEKELENEDVDEEEEETEEEEMILGFFQIQIKE